MKQSLLIVLLLGAGTLLARQADSLVNEGIKLHDAGKYNEAIEIYKQALVKDSKSYLINYEIAYSYSALKQYEEALRYADISLSFANSQTKLYPIILKGSVLDEMGRTEESVAFYKTALREFPDHYLLLFNYAVSATRFGHREEAEQALIKAIQNNNNHPGSHLQLSKINQDKNQKAKAALGLYFFLMLENNSARAQESAPVLLHLFYGQQKDSTRSIYITLPDSKKDSDWGSAELFFSFMGLASAEMDKALKNENTTRTEQQRFVNDTERFFKTMGELHDKRKKSSKKKKNNSGYDLWWNLYVPFFSSVVKNNHTEAFCYHIMASSNKPEIQEWIAANKEKLEYFYLWVNTTR